MEGVFRRRKVSKIAPKDVISKMPDNVVTSILDRLPLQDAVRTAILSRNWRFKWTMLSQLIFDDEFFEFLAETEGEYDHGRIISRLLLHLKGTITKFVLSIDEKCYSALDKQDIAHWVLFLSRNGVKDLTFEKRTGLPLKLPTHLFSCLNLKHLKLFGCSIDGLADFHGFPNLLSLELDDETLTKSIKLGELITRCPLIESLNMHLQEGCRFMSHTYERLRYSSNTLKLVEVSKHPNLKRLSVSLCFLEDFITISSSRIFELVFFPKREELHLDFLYCEWTEKVAKTTFPTAFPRLKALKLSSLDLGYGIVLSCVFEMIRCFPTLQTLEITAVKYVILKGPNICSADVDDNTMGMLLLRSVIFTCMAASENEVFLIKYLLACSPFLEKIVIRDLSLPYDQKLKFATELLKLHRASSAAEIVLC